MTSFTRALWIAILAGAAMYGAPTYTQNASLPIFTMSEPDIGWMYASWPRPGTGEPGATPYWMAPGSVL